MSVVKQRGMTLLELLIAIAILTVMMTLIGIKISQVNSAASSMNHQVERLERLNQAFNRLSLELMQAVERPISGSFQIEPAFNGELEQLEFTHAANQDVLSLTQSPPLERVRYELLDGALIRTSWDHLDREIEEPQHEVLIADGLEGLRFEYMPIEAQDWESEWNSSFKTRSAQNALASAQTLTTASGQSLSTSPVSNKQSASTVNQQAAHPLLGVLPSRVKVTLILPGYGEVDRSFEIAQNRFLP
ncbi:MAG: GspJ family type II secretion system protein [Pseudomonadota bacterium]|nr:GspJ family type II secretion system protein [Pseudomonadota bacterium]